MVARKSCGFTAIKIASSKTCWLSSLTPYFLIISSRLSPLFSAIKSESFDRPERSNTSINASPITPVPIMPIFEKAI